MCAQLPSLNPKHLHFCTSTFLVMGRDPSSSCQVHPTALRSLWTWRIASRHTIKDPSWVQRNCFGMVQQLLYSRGWPIICIRHFRWIGGFFIDSLAAKREHDDIWKEISRLFVAILCLQLLDDARTIECVNVSGESWPKRQYSRLTIVQ